MLVDVDEDLDVSMKMGRNWAFQQVDRGTPVPSTPTAEPFICDSNYFTADDDIRGMHDIVRAPAATSARYQIYAIDPATGNEIPEGRRDPEGSSSHASTQVTVSQAEWDAAQFAIVNNTKINFSSITIIICLFLIIPLLSVY